MRPLFALFGRDMILTITPNFENWVCIGRFMLSRRAREYLLKSLLTPCKCPANDIISFKFWKAKKIFKISKKTDEFSKQCIEIENEKYGTKYLKTHVHIVISKMVFFHQQLDIKF